LVGLGKNIFLNVREASENNSDMKITKVIAEVSSSTRQLQTAGRKKFKKNWCKELTQHSTGTESCDVRISFYPAHTTDENSKIVKSFAVT
jgi:hypothetical protein